MMWPFQLGPGLKEGLLQDKSGVIDAREATHFWLKKEENEEGGIESMDSDLDYESARERFRQALAQVGMDKCFSVEQFEGWVKNERRYGVEFANKVLVGLQPETEVRKGGIEELLNAAMNFVNRISRSRFKGKTPAQMKKKIPEEQSVHRFDIASLDKYLKMAEKGSEYLAQADFENAYQQFKNAVKMLADVRMPFIGAFRLYANAAICCFHKDDGDLGEELFNADLRLNPQYDFGIEQRQIYLEYNDPSRQLDWEELSTQERKLLQDGHEAYRAKGKRRYERTPFVRYEKFLAQAGISLNMPTETLSNVYHFNEDGQIESSQKVVHSKSSGEDRPSKKTGRNEPCPCGSGRKYKKCCGRQI